MASPEPTATVPALYRSASDGWRVGAITSLSNDSTAVVQDRLTGLVENVRPRDVVEMKTASDEALLDAAAVLRSNEGEDDVVHMRPAPIAHDGAVIEVLRQQYRSLREHICAGEVPENSTTTAFVGDNVSYTLRAQPPAGIVNLTEVGGRGEDAPIRCLGGRVHAALESTGQPQCVSLASAKSPAAEFGNSVADIAARLGATDEQLVVLTSAVSIVQAFTHDVHGQQHAVTTFNILAQPPDDKSQTHSYRAAALNVACADADRIAFAPTANWEVVGFLAFALSNEERERCYLPTRKSAKLFSAMDPSIAERADIVERLRERFFVFSEAMEAMKFEVHVQLSVFARITAAVHLLDVTFDEDGTMKNLSAMRNAAKLISADFNALSKVLTTRALCVAAAKFLYLSTFRFLLSKLNACLNPAGVHEGSGCRNVVTLVSGFAPEPSPTDAFHTPSRVSTLHELIRNVVAEDLAQRYYLSTEAELEQWQAEGFVVPEHLDAAFDAADNYPLLRLLKAKDGALNCIDAALALVFPMTREEPADEQPPNEGEEGAEGQGGEPTPEPEDTTPYFIADKDNEGRLHYAAIPPEEETEADKPAKKALPPVQLPVRNDNLALMSFIFAAEIVVGDAAPAAMKLEAGGEYIFTIGPSGNASLWKKDKSQWAGNMATDFVLLDIETAFNATLHVKPSGPKSKATELPFRLLVRATPEDRDAHNELMNDLMRALLHHNPKGEFSYVAPAEDDDAEGDDGAQQDDAAGAEAAAQRSAMSDAERAVDAVRNIFANLGKHKRVDYDEASHTLTVHHSFGRRTYELPPLSAAGMDPTKVPRCGAWLSAHAPCFDEMRQHLLAECDVETQEALYVEEQAHYESTLVSTYRQDIDTLVTQVFARPNTRFWFSFVVDTARGFNGEYVEQQLGVSLYPQVALLRRTLKHQYLPVPSAYLLSRFLIALPHRKRVAFRAATAGPKRDRLYAEEICLAADVPHVVGKTHMLIEARGFLRLQEYLGSKLRQAVATTQQFLRHYHSHAVVDRRIDAINAALTKDEDERRAIVALRQWQIDHAAQHRTRRLALQEEEFALRRAIADECWVEWVALQTAVQQELEDAMQSVVAKRIEARQAQARQVVKQSQSRAVHALAGRIQDRMLQQGQKLDQIVRQKLVSDSKSRERLQRMKKAHERLISMRVAQEEQKAVLEVQLEDKAYRIDRVVKHREARREEIRDELWQRQERERVVREQIERNRTILAQQAEEELAMEDIGFRMRQRVKDELAERQRNQREQLRQKYESERKAKDTVLQHQAKKQWTASVRRTKAVERSRSVEADKAKRDRVLLWQAQERERRAAERAKADEAQRQKTLTRNLLKAHTMLYTPTLFEQSARGDMRLSARSASRRRSKSAVSDHEGFVMVGSKRTYKSMLPAEVWDGIIRHHEDEIDRLSPDRNRAPSPFDPPAASPNARLRSASPRSVVSL